MPARFCSISVIDLPDDKFLEHPQRPGTQPGDIDGFHGEVLKMETDITNLLKDGFDENHPRISLIAGRTRRKEKQIKELVAGLRRAMRVDTDMAKSRVTLLQAEVDDLTTNVREDTTSAACSLFRCAAATSGATEPARGAEHPVASRTSPMYGCSKARCGSFPAPSRRKYPSKPNKNLNYMHQCGGRSLYRHRRSVSHRVSRYQREDDGRCRDAARFAGVDRHPEQRRPHAARSRMRDASPMPRATGFFGRNST